MLKKTQCAKRIELDWSRLLGFDQVRRRGGVLRDGRIAKVGIKAVPAALDAPQLAKVGIKG